MRLKSARLALAIGWIAFIGIGCGGDDSDSVVEPPTPTATPTRAATVSPTATPQSDPFVSPAFYRERGLDALRFATSVLAPNNVLNVLAHIEREELDPTFSTTPASVPADSWDPIFAKLARLEDTRDFDGLYLLNVLLGYRDHGILAPGLIEKVETALIGFKFWYTEPTPEGMLDNSYYWTENHAILYHTIEYLMGQEYPDRIFPSDGKTGREHFEHARELISRWFDLRARFGFAEWHSNVYYQKDFTPLLTLVEYADDEDIRTRAAMVLDILIFDLALHTHDGAFGVTHGRSYKKDKMTSLDDDTWGGVKMLFDQTEYPYQSISHPDAILLARARRYRLPEAIFRVARSGAAFTDRERMGIDLNELAPYEAHPTPPYEFSFTDPRDLDVWWGMGALTIWQIVPLTLETIEQYNLWDTTNFSPFRALQAVTGNLEFAQRLALRTAHYTGFGLLKEVNTQTHRTADYMLSSAQDYRKGSFGAQYHSWQATFDPNALIFTNHPVIPPYESKVWGDDDENGGYWTGEAAAPRSAQHENVAIHLYAPQYPPVNPPPLNQFHYQLYTHAYVPQDHFDEIVQEGPWTFGRFQDGYFALYSWRPTEWFVGDPAVIATNGMVKPFDLRADGGADNVWLVECGRAEDWGSFEAFRTAIAGSTLQVTRLPEAGNPPVPGGFDVVYESPSQGRITFGWDTPLTVRGAEVPITGYRRFDNPWSHTEFNTRVLTIEADGFVVHLDFERGVREVTAP